MNIASAYVEITEICNLDCTHCYNRSGRKVTGNYIIANSFARIINLLQSKGTTRISLAGGEPLLHPEWDKYMVLFEKTSEINYSVITNGTINNPYFIKLCGSLPNLSVQVSLDGACEDTNSQTRGKGNFKKTVSFIEKLSMASAKPKVSMTISSNNMNEIENFYKLITTIGGIPFVNFVDCMGNACDNWAGLSLEPQILLLIIKRIIKLNSLYNLDNKPPYSVFNCPIEKTAEPLSILIKCDGSIQPCQKLYDTVFILGNIFMFDDDIISHRIDTLREIYSKRQVLSFGCEKCINRSICHKGCLADVYNYSHEFFGIDGKCVLRRLQTMSFALTGVKCLQDNSTVMM